MSVIYLGKGTASTGNTTSITISLLPSSQNQFCIIYAYTYAYLSTMSWNVSSGWTKFIDYKNATYGSMVAAWKVLTGTESNPVISYTGAAKESIIGESIYFSGVDSSVIFDVSAISQVGIGTWDFPWDNIISEITTVTNGSLAVYIYGIKDKLTSTISNFTERDDTGTAAGSDAQAGFATKAMATAGGVGSCNLNYGSAGSGKGYILYKFALGPAVSVSVSPAASSFGLGTTNPITTLGLISFSPLPVGFGLSTTNPTVLGQSLVLEVFTDLGGAMSLASYALVYDDEDVEIASTGNYIQGTGIEITNVTNTIGNMWITDDILLEFVATRTVGSVSVFDSGDIKICTWTFSPALEIGPRVEYTLEWPDNGIEFPSPLWITPSSSSVGFGTTNPTVILGSLVIEPLASSFGLNTTDPTIPALPTLVIYPSGTPSAASYILILDDEENEIASTGEYVQGTGLVLSNVMYSDNRLYADDLLVDLVSATFFYLDLYDSDDIKIARWTTGEIQTITNSTFTFLWPPSGIYFSDYVIDVWPDAVMFGLGTTNPTVLYGSTEYTPTSASMGMTTTDPNINISLTGSILLTPESISLGLGTTNPDVVLGSLTIIPESAKMGLKTTFYSGIFYLTPLRRSFYGNTYSRESY